MKGKMIEEMAKVIRPILEHRVDIGFIPDLDKPIAEELVKQGYHKIPEGSVPLTMEEYDRTDNYISNLRCLIDNLNDDLREARKEKNDYKQRFESGEKRYEQLVQSSCEALEKGKDQVRKETAEKFARYIFNHITKPEVWDELRTLWLNVSGGKKSNLPIWNLLIEPVAKQFGMEVENERKT